MKSLRIEDYLRILLFTAMGISIFSGIYTGNISKVQATETGTRQELLSVAAKEVGYHEKETCEQLEDPTANSGSENYTKYAAEVDVTNGQPWGATFVWWCMKTAGVSDDSYPHLITATTDWFRNRELYRDRGTYIPQPGDYIVLGDVVNCGIVESVTEDSVTIIAGNRGETDSVTRSTLALNDSIIKGYGIINYSDTPTYVDLGDQFSAVITIQDGSKAICNTENNGVLLEEAQNIQSRWLFTKENDGGYVIKSLYDGKVLEISNTTISDKVNIYTASQVGNNNEKWYLYETQDGYNLVSKYVMNYCMSFMVDANTKETQICLEKNMNSETQIFSITKSDYHKLEGLSISTDCNSEMKIGETQTLNYDLNPADASSNTVIWSSSDTSVAEVDANGVVTAKSEGTVTIQCMSTYDNSIVDSTEISITENVSENNTTQQDTLAEQKNKQEVTTQQEATTEQQTTTEETSRINQKEVKKGTKIEGKQFYFEVTNVKKKTVKVTGSINKNATKVTIPATVKYENKTYKVTAIAKKAFKNNKKLKTVTIGSNVKTIGDNAFYGCKKLQKIVIGKNVTTIGKKAFYNCTKLNRIQIKSTKLKKVGKDAFKNISKKPVVWAPKSKIKAYKELFEGKM